MREANLDKKILELEYNLAKALDKSKQRAEDYITGLELELPESCLNNHAIEGLNLILEEEEGFQLSKREEGRVLFRNIKNLFKEYQPQEEPAGNNMEEWIITRLPEISERRWRQYIHTHGMVVIFDAILPIPPLRYVETANLHYKHHGDMDSYQYGYILAVLKSEKDTYLCFRTCEFSMIQIPLTSIIMYKPTRD